ncbi:MAG: biotin--[acetyl-CoA-carboxylase] ligase [Tannerella sp.]|jgi:BirA family biotin operon repressor/biotin-[acetyl-CoA-carboxylase] ligase|nr:biotin--[acetyl-CoA-carboxylase] ligase [Tannerella sp.]
MNNNIDKPRLIHIKETDSTNKFMQMVSQTEELPSGSIVWADFQTAGRGQTGNSWESEAGENLTFSVLLRPADVPANRPFIISEMASLSVKYTLDKYIAGISVKWPNDIYCGDRKITGMLIENIIQQGKITQSILGIGINVNQTEFRSNAPNPVSMTQIAGRLFDRLSIMEDFRQIFAGQCERLNNSGFDAIHRDYFDALYRKDGYHKYSDTDGVFEARIYDIEPTGHLILERMNEILSRYAFKEVTYID